MKPIFIANATFQHLEDPIIDFDSTLIVGEDVIQKYIDEIITHRDFEKDEVMDCFYNSSSGSDHLENIGKEEVDYEYLLDCARRNVLSSVSAFFSQSAGVTVTVTEIKSLEDI